MLSFLLADLICINFQDPFLKLQFNKYCGFQAKFGIITILNLILLLLKYFLILVWQNEMIGHHRYRGDIIWSTSLWSRFEISWDYLFSKHSRHMKKKKFMKTQLWVHLLIAWMQSRNLEIKKQTFRVNNIRMFMPAFQSHRPHAY